MTAVAEVSVRAPYLERWDRVRKTVRQEVWRERSRLTVSEWAERHRILTQGPMAGQRWRNEEAPYLVEIMDYASDPFRSRKAVVKKSARVGYTEGVIGNILGYFIDQEPTNVIVMQPTDEEADNYSKENLDLMLRQTPAIRRKLHLDSYKDSRNTIAYKAFAGGSLSIIGPKPSNLRRRSARFALSDEIDELDVIHEQGDPLARLDKRLDDFDDAGHMRGSTPTNKGLSRIDAEFDDSDQRRYFIECPHCGESQYLRWGGPDVPYGIKWEKDVVCRSCGSESEDPKACSSCGEEGTLDVTHLPETAHYVCVKGCRIEESEKRDMIQPENGAGWIPTNPEGRYPGWHIHALMSLFPGARWTKLVDEFLEAKDDPEKLKVFVNTVLGEAWEERDRKKLKPEALKDRAENYRDTDGKIIEVPAGVGVLVAGVDVQSDRLELLIRGYGIGEESWDILHERIWGDPRQQQVWGQLDFRLVTPLKHESGNPIRVAATMIDCGYLKDEVFTFVRPRDARNVWASRGDKGEEGAVPLSRPVRSNADGVKVWTIGTFTMKDKLFDRLSVEVPGPRYTHLRQHTPEFCNGFDAEYFAQAGGERKIRQRVKGAMRWRNQYVQTRRNEFIDLQVMCDAALRALGPVIYENMEEWVEMMNSDPAEREDAPVEESSDWATRGGRWGR